MKTKIETKCPFCGSLNVDLDDFHDFEFEANFLLLVIWRAHCKDCHEIFFRRDKYKFSDSKSFKSGE